MQITLFGRDNQPSDGQWGEAEFVNNHAVYVKTSNIELNFKNNDNNTNKDPQEAYIVIIG